MSGSVSCGISGSWWAQGFVLALQGSLASMRFDSKHDFASIIVLLGAYPLLLDVRYLFLVGSNIRLLMVVHQRVAILVFSQEKMSALPSTMP